MSDNPSTGEQLIIELDELRESLLTLSDRLNKSGIERTNGLRENMGTDCPYFKKSLDIFMKKDYADVKTMIESILDLIKLIEGNSSGP